jgi:hypothetical protein
VRRGVVIAAGWGAAVGAAALAGVASIDTLAGSAGGGPLSQQQVADRLAHASSSASRPASPPASSGASEPAASPTTGTGPSTGPSPTRQYYTTSGGSLWATCTGDSVTLDTMAPRPGYRIDGFQPGPASAAWVKFKVDVSRGHATEYLVTVTCAGGVPQKAETTDS